MSNNVKMAEILGFQKTDLGWYDNEEVISDEIYEQNNGNTFDENQLKFDSDYNWLMIAIQHLQSISSEPEEIESIRDLLWHGYSPKDILESILEKIETIEKVEPEEPEEQTENTTHIAILDYISKEVIITSFETSKYEVGDDDSPEMNFLSDEVDKMNISDLSNIHFMASEKKIKVSAKK